MMKMMKLADEEFKIVIIDLFKGLKESLNIMRLQIGNLNGEIKTIKSTIWNCYG